MAWRFRGMFIALAAVLCMADAVPAQPLDIEAPGREARELIHGLMSPFCPGLLLSDCRSEGARLLRVEIDRRFSAGESREAIEADLVARFGPEVRTMPATDGVGLIAWVAPPVLGLVGLWFACRAIRRFTGANGGAAPPGLGDRPAADQEMDVRVRDELAALD